MDLTLNCNSILFYSQRGCAVVRWRCDGKYSGSSIKYSVNIYFACLPFTTREQQKIVILRRESTGLRYNISYTYFFELDQIIFARAVSAQLYRYPQT